MPSAILLAARSLISEPARWTQGTSARDVHGRSDTPGSPDAVCWCASGALQAVTKLCRDALYCAARSHLERALPDARPIAVFNDTEEHETVIALFDRAIAYAAQQEAA